MKKYIYIINKALFLLAIIYAGPIDGQWKQYLYTDGISSNYTFHTHKDDKNRIWIGTQNVLQIVRP